MEIHGSLGFKMHCWAGWWGHVPLLDAILSATEISVLNLAADLDQEDAWRRRPPRFEDALLGGLAGTWSPTR